MDGNAGDPVTVCMGAPAACSTLKGRAPGSRFSCTKGPRIYLAVACGVLLFRIPLSDQFPVIGDSTGLGLAWRIRLASYVASLI